jgi:hypothetical protein
MLANRTAGLRVGIIATGTAAATTSEKSEHCESQTSTHLVAHHSKRSAIT